MVKPAVKAIQRSITSFWSTNTDSTPSAVSAIGASSSSAVGVSTSSIPHADCPDTTVPASAPPAKRNRKNKTASTVVASSIGATSTTAAVSISSDVSPAAKRMKTGAVTNAVTGAAGLQGPDADSIFNAEFFNDIVSNNETYHPEINLDSFLEVESVSVPSMLVVPPPPLASAPLDERWDYYRKYTRHQDAVWPEYDSEIHFSGKKSFITREALLDTPDPVPVIYDSTLSQPVVS